MGSHFQIHPLYRSYESEVHDFIDHFSTSGNVIYKGSRNELRVREFDDMAINIKRFKKPNLINQFAYRWLRMSKAKRSFLFADHLLKNGVNTPHPIAYQEDLSSLGLLKSYYVSVHQPYDFTIRALIYEPDFPEREEILRAFTRFTYDLHNKDILFTDHSPGNTLIKRTGKHQYEFYIVDLNRMNFKKLSFHERMQNFSRLTPEKEMHRIMADEYARLTKKDRAEVFQWMWEEVKKARKKIERKENFKRKIRSHKNNQQ